MEELRELVKKIANKLGRYEGTAKGDIYFDYSKYEYSLKLSNCYSSKTHLDLTLFSTHSEQLFISYLASIEKILDLKIENKEG